MERAGLFLQPLDEVRGWWRYHQLFADLLRARLAQQPDRSAQLHRRAAGWYDAHEMADDAVRHAVAAGDVDWAARLIEGNFDRTYCLRGEAATLRDWLSALPADLVWTRPRLLLAQAQLAAAAARVDEEERLVDAAERAWAETPGEPFQPPAGAANSLLVNVPALIAIHRSYLAILRGDADATVAFASRALANLGEDERMLEYVASSQSGQRGMASRPAGRSRGHFRAQPGPMGRRTDRPGLGPPRIRPDPAGPGPFGRGRPDLSTNAGCYGASRAAPRYRRPALHTSAWARSPTGAISSTSHSTRSPQVSRCAAGSPTRRRWPPAWSPWPGSARPRVIRLVPQRRWGRRPSYHRDRMDCSTRFRPTRPGCCWPTATWAAPPTGSSSVAFPLTASPTTPASRGTWSWPECWWPRTSPTGPSPC